MNKGWLVIGGLALGVALLVKKTTIPSTPLAPMEFTTPADLLGKVKVASNLSELDALYNLLGMEFVSRQIDFETYRQIYAAYTQRFYELASSAITARPWRRPSPMEDRKDYRRREE